jgi:hypothetical protein
MAKNVPGVLEGEYTTGLVDLKRSARVSSGVVRSALVRSGRTAQSFSPLERRAAVLVMEVVPSAKVIWKRVWRRSSQVMVMAGGLR